MERIAAPTKQAEMFCGSQKILPGTHYRRTKHCIDIICDESRLLYHTLTGELLLLRDDIDKTKVEDDLIRSRFLVPEETDECRFADDFRSFLKLINPDKKNKTTFTILTTTDCNARCFYCYEMGRKRISMSMKTAREAASYIAEASMGEPVKIHWFGGEPLYNIPAIDTILSGLKERGVEYISTITTNGYYFDKTIAEKAKQEWHTQLVQITLDGTEQIYNTTKSYIDKDHLNPYLKVMENIGYALAEGMKVCIRLNLDQRNAEDLFSLCDELSAKFGRRDNLIVNLAFLQALEGEIHPFPSEEEAASCFLALYDKLIELGLNSPERLERRIRANKCMADNLSSEVILPDGKLGRCEHFSESEIVGSMEDGVCDEDLVHSWMEIAEPFDPCRECAIYPRCINLKKCDWNRNGCPESIRIVRTELLKKQILREYSEWKRSLL